MSGFLSALSDAVLGNPANAARPQPPVPSYEDLHNGTQSIFIPQSLPKGLSINAVTPLNSRFAVTHRLTLESGKPKAGGLEQFAGMGGMGGAPKDERSHRAYSGGLVFSHASEGVRCRVDWSD